MTMSTQFDDLPAHLRRWGLKVEELSGWRFRERPYSFHPKAVICHHTASPSNSGNFGSSNIVAGGRPDLPGPLAQFLLGRDGTVRVISGGYANHAGIGGPRAGIPANMGNTYAWGIEAENNGIGEKWGPVQLNAYYRLCAALLAYMNTTDVSKVFGHKEWTTRKIDPAGIDMNKFRARVKDALAHGPSVVTVHLSRIRPGKSNQEIVRVKRRLHKRGYFKNPKFSTFFGKDLRDAIREFQLAQGWTGADADGIPGQATLNKLGFNVVS